MKSGVTTTKNSVKTALQDRKYIIIREAWWFIRNISINNYLVHVHGHQYNSVNSNGIPLIYQLNVICDNISRQSLHQWITDRVNPPPMETISYMGMLGIICDCIGTGRKIHHVIRSSLIHERLPTQKELPLKLNVWHDQLGLNRASAKTKAIPLFAVGNQACQWFLCHIKIPSLVKPKIRPHLNLLGTRRVDRVYLIFLEVTRTTD